MSGEGSCVTSATRKPSLPAIVFASAAKSPRLNHEQLQEPSERCYLTLKAFAAVKVLQAARNWKINSIDRWKKGWLNLSSAPPLLVSLSSCTATCPSGTAR